MQTTSRIDDRLYREAKAEAARDGVTLMRFLEERLRLRLERRLAEIFAPNSTRCEALPRTMGRTGGWLMLTMRSAQRWLRC